MTYDEARAALTAADAAHAEAEARKAAAWGAVLAARVALREATAAALAEGHPALWTEVDGLRWATDGAALVSLGLPLPSEDDVTRSWYAPAAEPLRAMLRAERTDRPHPGPFAPRMAPVLLAGRAVSSALQTRELVGFSRPVAAVLDELGAVRALVAPLLAESWEKAIDGAGNPWRTP